MTRGVQRLFLDSVRLIISLQKKLKMINLNIYLFISYLIVSVKLNCFSRKKQKIRGCTDYWEHERTMGGSPGVLSEDIVT